MSPRSWQPSSSIVQQEPIKQVKLIENSNKINKAENSMPSVVNSLNEEPVLKTKENVKTTKNKTKQFTDDSRPSSVNKISKSMNSKVKSPQVSNFDLTKSLARNKTFLSPAEIKKNTTPRRLVSFCKK